MFSTVATDVYIYSCPNQFRYVDIGMDISMRTKILFQVKASTDWAIGLKTQPFTAADSMPDYSVILDWTNSSNAFITVMAV